jgi:hypothetical protein
LPFHGDKHDERQNQRKKHKRGLVHGLARDGGFRLAENALGSGIVGNDDNHDGDKRDAENFHDVVTPMLDRFDNLTQNKAPESDNDNCESEKENPVPRVLIFGKRCSEPRDNRRRRSGI